MTVREIHTINTAYTESVPAMQGSSHNTFLRGQQKCSSSIPFASRGPKTGESVISPPVTKRMTTSGNSNVANKFGTGSHTHTQQKPSTTNSSAAAASPATDCTPVISPPVTKRMTTSGNSNVANKFGTGSHTHTQQKPSTTNSSAAAASPATDCTPVISPPVTKRMTTSGNSNVANKFGTGSHTQADKDGFILVKKRVSHAKKPTQTTVIVGGTEYKFCSGWVQYCIADPDTQKTLNRCVHSKNDHRFPHGTIPICRDFMTSTCKFGANCHRMHPERIEPMPEIVKVASFADVKTVQSANPAVSTVRPVSAKYTRVCKTWLIKMFNEYDDEVKPCMHHALTGRHCNFAHSEHVCVDTYTSAYEAYMSGEGKQNKMIFQTIFEECYKSIKDKRDIINSLRCESGNHIAISAIPQPIPENFIEIVKLWMSAASMARKLNKADKFPLFDGCDSPMENLVWIFARRIQTCTKDRDCHYNCLIDIKIDESHICVYGDACERGTHLSNCDDSGVSKRICVKNLISSTCDCKFKSAKEAESKRSELKAKLAQLKQERDIALAMKKSAKTIIEQISKVANELISCICLNHLVSDNGFHPITAIVETNVDVNVHPTDADFIRALPKMTEEQKAQYTKDQTLFRLRWEAEEAERRKLAVAHQTLRHFIKRIRFGRLIKTLDPSSPIDCAYIVTGAYQFMSKDDFVMDFLSIAGRVFLNWYLNSRTIPFYLFAADVKNKMLIWDSMGVNKRIVPGTTWEEDETIEEYWVPSDKDNFRGFWQWYYNVPFARDTTIVGSAIDLAEECPELFAEYLEANPSFGIKFDKWVESDALHSNALKVLRANSNIISFYSAIDYVRMKVDEFGMSVADFVTYNRRDVAAWIAVNKDRKLLGSESVSMTDFLAESDKFTEFYSKGMWRIYNGDFTAYCDSKKDGWSHVSLTTDLESASKLHEIALKRHEEKMAAKELKDTEMNDLIQKVLVGDFSGIYKETLNKVVKTAKLTSVKESDNSFKKFSKKHCKKRNKKRGKKSSESDSDSNSVPASDSESDSDSEGMWCITKRVVTHEDFDDDDLDDDDLDDDDDLPAKNITVENIVNEDFSTDAEFFAKSEKKLPFNGKMMLGYSHEFYIHRDEKHESRDKSDAVVRTISIGPFATEEQARSIKDAIRVYNKTKVGRGMVLNLEKTDGDENTSTCWNVCYGDTVVGRFEKPDSYNWMSDLILSLSKSVLPDTTLNSWVTNIPTLSKHNAEIIERNESAPSQSKVPSKVPSKTPAVAPSIKSSKPVKTKRTSDDIRKEKEEKAIKKLAADEARKAEAVGLAAKKLAEKAFAKPKVAPKVAPKVEPKDKVVKLMVETEIAIY